jgi:hypothetical protein
MQISILNWRLVGVVTLLMASFSASADTRVEQVWSCTLNADSTLEDLNAVHGKWLAWANSQSYGGDIQGFVVSPIVSSNLESVLIIDSYPDFATFVADGEAYASSEEGQAINDEYEAVSTCTSNALYSVTDSGSD